MLNNRGVILVVFPFLLLGLLGVGALAIDMGSLGQMQNVVTRAADAGTVAALKHRAQVGWSVTNSEPERSNALTQSNSSKPSSGFSRPLIMAEAFNATRFNLITAGILSPSEGASIGAGSMREIDGWYVQRSVFDLATNPGRGRVHIIVQYRSQQDESISVIVIVDANYLLANAIFEGLGRRTFISNAPPEVAEYFSTVTTDRWRVDAPAGKIPYFATGELKPIDVELMLDASNSMSCPLTGGCECAKTTAGCPRTTKSIGGVDGNYFFREGELRDAALTFTRLFNPYRDRIGLHSFKTTAITLKGLQDPNCAAQTPGVPRTNGLLFCPGRFTSIFQSHNALNPSGGTNVIDALQHAWTDYNDAPQVPAPLGPERHVFWVLFSDGAPTAGRFSYADPRRKLQTATGQVALESCPASAELGVVSANGNLEPCLSPNPTNSDFYDYYHYAIEWPSAATGASTTAARSNKVFSGPSVLVRAGTYDIETSNDSRTCQDEAELSSDQLKCYTAIKKDSCGGRAHCGVWQATTTAERSACSLFSLGVWANLHIQPHKFDQYEECLLSLAANRQVLGTEDHNEGYWLPYGYSFADPRADGIYRLQSGAVPWCSQLARVANFKTTGANSLGNANKEALGNCLNDLSYSVPPGSMDGVFAKGVLPTTLNWKREYYHGAITWADTIRGLATKNRHSAVYTIGLGQPISGCKVTTSSGSNSVVVDPKDPYQCIEEKGENKSRDFYHNFARKDVFLSRVARDLEMLNNGHVAMPGFSFAGNPECEEGHPGGAQSCERNTKWSHPDSTKDGRYVFTANPQFLRNRFAFVGRNILLRVLDGQ